MDFQTGTVSGKSGAGNVMDWSVNNAFKSLKDMESKSLTVMDSSIIPNIDQIPLDIGVSPPDKGNSALNAKPRKKTMTSVYLKYFETALDGKSRRCKFCGQSYSIATATGNLGRHLSNRHPGYDKSGDITSSPSPQTVTIAKKPQAQAQAHAHAHAQAQAKAPQMELDHLNWLLIKWLVVSSLPPSTTEEKWLKNSFKFCNPSTQLWSGEKFRVVLKEVFSSMQDDVRVIMEQVSSKISITLDFWTSYEQIMYMSTACQWIDEHWTFQKVLLDISRIPSPCGGDEIYHALMKVLKSYNIGNRVLSCTHDNSPNAVHACHTLKDDIDGHKLGPFCYVPCAAHTLSSMINDGLKTTKSIISKIRELVLEMNSSLEIFEDFTQYAAAYQEGNWKFPLDSSARWSGNYQMLDIAHKAGKSIETITRKYDKALGSRVLLKVAEKNAVNIMHTYLEPFYKTINNICTSKMLTIGLVLFFMDHILEMILASRDSRHNPDWLKTAAEEMATQARSYNDQVCNVFTYMTAILDPRIKVELLPESLNSDSYLVEARSHFMRNYSTTHFPSMTNSYASLEAEDGGSVSFAEEIARKKRRASMPSATDELTQYLSEPPAPLSTDVLEWWKVNSTRYPRLSVMARDFLAVQATAVAPEDLFSQKGDEIDSQRLSLPHHSMQSLLCIKSWLEVGVRLKYKSTEVDCDRLVELASASAENSNTNADRKQK